MRNLDKAYTGFFKGRSKSSKFKSKKKSSATFYSRYGKVKFYENGTVNLEKIGKVNYKSSYDLDLTKISKLSNPTVTFNGRCWILTVGLDIEPIIDKLEDKSINYRFRYKTTSYC